MTNVLTPTRRLERAIDEIRRGYAVRLCDGVSAVDVQAAEMAEAQAGEAPLRLILSARRARYLGLTAESGADAIALPGVEAAMLPTLLYAAHASPDAAAEPADAMDRLALELVCRSGLLPAALVSPPRDAAALELSAAHVHAALPTALALDTVVSMPTALDEAMRVAVFRERGGITHLALLAGDAQKIPAPLVRLHSSCLTGDVLGSLRCDCGDQLRAALKRIAAAGGGVLLYLNQEGRGIGLANKLRAYRLQEEGLDTVDANLALGFAGDEREYTLAAQMLRSLGLRTIRLLTNNPHKVEALRAAGLTVSERLPLAVSAGKHNKNYLLTKAKRLGHLD